MPYVGVPFGSMHLVPMTRWSYVRYTSFDSQDKLLRGFNLTRQPEIWMGEWGATRIFFPEPKKIERIDAKPFLTTVKAGGRTCELTASSHKALRNLRTGGCGMRISFAAVNLSSR